MKFVTIIEDRVYEFLVRQHSREWVVVRDGLPLQTDCVPLDEGSFSLLVNRKSYFIRLVKNKDGIDVTIGQKRQFIRVRDESEQLLEKFGFRSNESNHAGKIQVPIPGLLTRLFVKPGDKVEKGTKLAILEAMKMENEISSPVTGTVTHCHISEGTAVEKGELILELKL